MHLQWRVGLLPSAVVSMLFRARLAAAAAAGRITGAAGPGPQHAEEGEEPGEGQNGEDLGHHGVDSPAKPMKASERLPAMINTRPIPLAA